MSSYAIYITMRELWNICLLNESEIYLYVYNTQQNCILTRIWYRRNIFQWHVPDDRQLHDN